MGWAYRHCCYTFEGANGKPYTLYGFRECLHDEDGTVSYVGKPPDVNPEPTPEELKEKLTVLQAAFTRPMLLLDGRTDTVLGEKPCDNP